MDQDVDASIKVVCRIRPLNAMEKKHSTETCLDIQDPYSVKIRLQSEMEKKSGEKPLF